MSSDDYVQPPGASSLPGVACAVFSILLVPFALLLAPVLLAQILVIGVAPALAGLGIWLSVRARRDRGPATAGLVTSMAAFALTGTIATWALVIAIVIGW